MSVPQNEQITLNLVKHPFPRVAWKCSFALLTTERKGPAQRLPQLWPHAPLSLRCPSLCLLLLVTAPWSVLDSRPTQAWHAWAVMNFEAVLHYKHQNQARDEKKKLRHASGANITSAATAATTAATATATATSTEGSNSESEAESSENSPTPSPLQKKVTEVLGPSSSLRTDPGTRR